VAGMVFYQDFVGPKADSFWNGVIYQAEAGHGMNNEHATELKHESLHDDNSKSAPHTEGHENREHGAQGTHAVESNNEKQETHGGDEHHVPIWVLFAPFVAMLTGSFAAAAHYLRGSNPLRPGL